MKTLTQKTKTVLTVMAVAVSLFMTACSSDKSSSSGGKSNPINPNCVGCPGYNQSNIYADALGLNNGDSKEMGVRIYKDANNSIATEGYMLIRSDMGNMCRLLNGEYDVVTLKPGHYDPASDQIFDMELSLRHVSLSEEIIVRVEYMSRLKPTTGGYYLSDYGGEYPFGLRAKLNVMDVISGDARRDTDCHDYLNYGSIELEFSPPQSSY